MSPRRLAAALALLTLPGSALAADCYAVTGWSGVEPSPSGWTDYVGAPAELEPVSCTSTPGGTGWLMPDYIMEMPAEAADTWFLLSEDDPVLAQADLFVWLGWDADGLPVLVPDIVLGTGGGGTMLTASAPEDPPAPWAGEAFLAVDTPNTDAGCLVEATLQVTGVDGTDASAMQFDVHLWGDHMDGIDSLADADPFGTSVQEAPVAGGLLEVDGGLLVPHETEGTVYGARTTRSGETELVAVPFACSCPTLQADLDGDGAVGVGDLVMLLGAYGTASDTVDLDGDGTVGASDVMILFTEYGQVGC